MKSKHFSKDCYVFYFNLCCCMLACLIIYEVLYLKMFQIEKIAKMSTIGVQRGGGGATVLRPQPFLDILLRISQKLHCYLFFLIFEWLFEALLTRLRTFEGFC